MTGKELTALLSRGKELILGGPGKGYAGSLMLNANGTGKGQVKLDSGEVIPIEGVWAIKKDKFCRTWNGGRDAGQGDLRELGQNRSQISRSDGWQKRLRDEFVELVLV